MMDYLSNLTNRSFDLSEGEQFVQPRLPSRFESTKEIWQVPVDNASHSPLREESGEEQPASPLSMTGARLSRQAPAVESADDPFTATVKASENAPHLPRSHSETPPTTPGDPRGQVRPAASLLHREKRAGAASVRVAEQSSPGTRLAREKSTERSRSMPLPGLKAGRAAHAQDRPQEAGVGAETVDVQGRVAPIPDSVISSGNEGRVPGEAVLPRMVETLPHPVPTISPANAEPTIQVTIGRIEIRASASTAPKRDRPRPKAPAAMTLNDYLQRRSGGAR
jgi:hypothetical protein